MRVHGHVIRAVFQRNFISYFSNPIGYLFITAFVWACAYFAFWHNDLFFASNIADLDPLNKYFPYLLLFFVPAITMTVWAEERKSGTEELLLTLPASDLEIVLGKYLASVAIFTVSLGFSLSNVVVLRLLGRPDLGMTFSSYLGYWLLGSALLAAGMAASLLTSNVTVAFILGSFACLILVSFEQLASVFPAGAIRDFVARMGVTTHFESFGQGTIKLASVFYFISVVVVMLYLNLVLLSRRHWAGSQHAGARWTHSVVRAASIAVAAVSVTVLAGRAEAYLDFDATQERIFSLSPQSHQIIDGVDPNRPVLIEAFISPTVPKELVETRKNLIDLLRRFEAMGNGRIGVKINNTEIYSQEARDAERVYDIKPEIVPSMQDGRFDRVPVFMGVAFKCGLNQKVIPFFFRGLPIEYELTRMIRTVSEKNKRKVGVLTTDAGLFGSFNFQMMRANRDWLIIDELRQQYDVVQVSPDTQIDATLDVLIVPMASSLSQTQMDNLYNYVLSGKATLILDDPMPVFNPDLAARAQKQRQNPMGMMGGQPPPTPKGNLKKLTDALNIEFDAGNIIWERWNPHPQFKGLPPEYVFVGPGSGNPEAFNQDNVATSGLQEIILMYPGGIRSRGGDGPTFTPLLMTGGVVGTTPWNDVFTEGILGMRGLNEFPKRRGSATDFVLAALIRGKFIETPLPPPAPEGEKKDEKKPEPPKPADANVIFIADLDMIHDAFFELRRQGEENLQFDNVTFVANCVDLLAGDESFVELRKKRLKRRNLELIDRMTRSFNVAAEKSEEKAEEDAAKELAAAQKQFDEKVDAIRKRTDIDRRAKQAQIEYLQQVEQRRFDVRKEEIERAKKEQIRKAKDQLESRIREVQTEIKIAAVAIPPIPALVLGIIVFFARRAGEREGVDPKRLV